MPRLPYLLAPLLVVGASTTGVVLAPSAAAGPPVASSGPADATINDLKAQGYNVQINWVNGFDTKPLSECWVTGVNNPGNTPPSAGTFTTVYVDVACPNGDDDGFGITGGIG